MSTFTINVQNNLAKIYVNVHILMLKMIYALFYMTYKLVQTYLNLCELT